MTTAQRIGTIFMAAGSLIVLGVVVVWLAAPINIPKQTSRTIVYERSLNPLSAPALSPFNPQAVPAVEDAPNSTLPEIDTSTTGEQSQELESQPSSSSPNNYSFDEDKTVGAYIRASSEQSLHISIPALGVDAPIVPVSLSNKQGESGRPYQQWSVPDSYAVGWHDSSAPPGQAGNTVLNGHNNIHGAVFGDLVNLTLGEQIILYEANRQYIYQVVHREFLPEQGETLRTRLWNARWIAPSDDTRLTIVTCWPNTSNSYRLVVIAQPLMPEAGF